METSTARALHDPAADFYIDALQKLFIAKIEGAIDGWLMPCQVLSRLDEG